MWQYKTHTGGTAYSSSPFELNLQLHGQVSNPYSFSIKQNYKSSASTQVEFTYQEWITPGTYTWVAPFTGAISVCVIGGGGGGARSGNSSTDGSSSSFEQIIAYGGGRGYAIDDEGWEMHAGSGGQPNGRSGSSGRGSGVISGGTGFDLSKTITNGSYGAGGSVRGQNLFSFKASGGSGGCNIQQVNVTIGESYQVIVGAGGKGNAPNADYYAYNGNSGAVGIWKE